MAPITPRSVLRIRYSGLLLGPGTLNDSVSTRSAAMSCSSGSRFRCRYIGPCVRRSGLLSISDRNFPSRSPALANRSGSLLATASHSDAQWNG